MPLHRLNDVPDPKKPQGTRYARPQRDSSDGDTERPQEARESRNTWDNGERSERRGGSSKKQRQYKPRASYADRLAAAQARIAALPRTEQVEKAKELALYVLTASMKTRKQLTTKLTEKGYPEDVTKEVLDRLEELHLLNDASFARNYATSKQRSSSLGAGRIKRELLQKGVDAETVAEALEEVDGMDEDGQYEAALELLRKKAPSTRNLEPTARVRRLAGLLARKGYSPAFIFRAVKEVLAEEGSTVEDVPFEE